MPLTEQQLSIRAAALYISGYFISNYPKNSRKMPSEHFYKMPMRHQIQAALAFTSSEHSSLSLDRFRKIGHFPPFLNQFICTFSVFEQQNVNSAEFLKIEFFPSGEKVFEKVSQKLAKESFRKMD